jgi:hypothetical protein
MGLMLMREAMNRKPVNALIECAWELLVSYLRIGNEELPGSPRALFCNKFRKL